MPSALRAVTPRLAAMSRTRDVSFAGR